MVGDQLKRARIRAGISQAEWAKRSGVSRKQISSAENGANVSAELIQRLLDALPTPSSITIGNLRGPADLDLDFDEVRKLAGRLLIDAGALHDLMSQHRVGSPPTSHRSTSDVFQAARDNVRELLERIQDLPEDRRQSFFDPIARLITIDSGLVGGASEQKREKADVLQTPPDIVAGRETMVEESASYKERNLADSEPGRSRRRR